MLTLEKTFETWLKGDAVEIGTIQALMGEPLSDSMPVLIRQVTLIEAWQARLVNLLADANAFLDLAEYREIMTIDRDLTSLERGVTLKAKVVGERRIRDNIQGLYDVVHNRIILAQSLIKRQSQETNRHA